jgi:hypothetical protein
MHKCASTGYDATRHTSKSSHLDQGLHSGNNGQQQNNKIIRNYNSLTGIESNIYLKGRHFTQLSQDIPIKTSKNLTHGET